MSRSAGSKKTIGIANGSLQEAGLGSSQEQAYVTPVGQRMLAGIVMKS